MSRRNNRGRDNNHVNRGRGTNRRGRRGQYNKNRGSQIDRRAYIIVHFFDKETNSRKVLLGKERVINDRAIKDLKNNIAKIPCNKLARQQFSTLHKKIASQNSNLVKKDGMLNIRRGPWRLGRHLSGVLLIGSTALPGGRVEEGETFKKAATRELQEEYHLDPELVKRFQQNFIDNLEILTTNQIQISNRKTRKEHFFSLDLNSLNPALRKQLDPAALVESFNQITFPSLQERWEQDLSQKMADLDKRSLYVCDYRELPSKISGWDNEDKAFNREQIDTFAQIVCHELQNQFPELSPLDFQNFSNKLFEYQQERKLPSMFEASEIFVEKYSQNMEALGSNSLSGDDYSPVSRNSASLFGEAGADKNGAAITTVVIQKGPAQLTLE